MPILLLMLLFLTSVTEARPLFSDSLVVVHASRHYHTDRGTIQETNRLIEVANANGQNVIGLGQNAIVQDPEWYTYRALPQMTASYLSRAGENDLAPIAAKKFRVTLIGGYYSACLGWALSEILAQFLSQPGNAEIEIQLPMKAIFTGYRFINGKRMPQAPYEEANADSSLNGLNLFEVTKSLNDEDFSQFILETLNYAVFDNAPIVKFDLTPVTFELVRDEKTLRRFHFFETGTEKIHGHKAVKFLHL